MRLVYNDMYERKGMGETRTTPLATQLSDKEIAYAKEFAKGIQVTDTTTILKYGTVPQKKFNAFADRSILDIPVNDLNDVDKVIKELLGKLNGFEKGILAKKDLRAGSKKSMQEFRSAYDRFSADIDEGERKLEVLRDSILRHVNRMERVYAECYAIVREFDMYVLAAEYALADGRNTRLQEVEERAKKTGLLEDYMKVTDYTKALDRLEKKKQTLALTRALPLQTLAQIRLIQETDGVIAENLNNLVAHVFPLYKNRVIISLSVKENSAPLIDTDEFMATNASLRDALEGILKARKSGVAKQKESFLMFGKQ